MEPECSLQHSQVPAPCPYLEPARSSPQPHIPLVPFPSLRSYQIISPGPMLTLWIFRNMICFDGEELLAHRSTPKLDDHRLLAVSDCLFNIFAAIFHMGGCSFHPKTDDAPCRGDRDPHLTWAPHPCWDVFLWDGHGTCNAWQTCCLLTASGLAMHVFTTRSVLQGPREWERETTERETTLNLVFR